MRRLKLGLIGAGERGAHSYAPYALKHPGEVQMVCVAEPLEERREVFAARFGIPESMRFAGWEAMLDAKPELDGVIVATQDTQHYEPAMAALEMGYHMLLEKPMAETLEKTGAIVGRANERNRLLMVCHVLRYTPFFEEMKAVIDSGAIGRVQAVHHIENIGNWHFSHSFVRGNWSNAKQSTPMIVAKCCHDMDILNFLIGKKCERLSSFGRLGYFVPENAPAGATARCVDCPHNKHCAFSCYNYLGERGAGFSNVVSRTSNTVEFLRILETSPYGRCVYRCENDVADHQVVNMEYEDGITVSFTASAFTSNISRQIKLMGTRGELEGRLEDDLFVQRDFGSGKETIHKLRAPGAQHAGGDEKIMARFCEALRDPERGIALYSASNSLAGHAMAFAAEQSRLAGGAVVSLD